VIMWYFMLNSGIHATITGVLLAFAIPYGNGDERSPSYILQHFLHMPVAFIILPLFALANTGLVFNLDWYHVLTEPLGLGVILGLTVGKPLGILLFSLLGVVLGLCVFPSGITWKHIFGVGFLGGIGFTMSIFVTLLAFDEKVFIDGAKTAIICASLFSGLVGYLWLSVITKSKSEHS
jgi:NhaA family Na+:H+ antiporter